MKRTPLKRYTPVRKRRAKPRRGQPTTQEKGAIRERVYAACGGLCQLRIDKKRCSGDRVLPLDGDLFERWHLVHRHAKRRFGFDQGDALRGGCYWCHEWVHHKGWPKGM